MALMDEERIKKKIEEFGGLLDEQTARLLLEYEDGKVTAERREKLQVKLEKMLNSNEEILVLENEGVREYTKKNGQKGRLLSVKISNQSGEEGRLLFWDSQIEEVDDAGLLPGERLMISNVSKSSGKYGLSYSLNEKSVIKNSSQILYPHNK